MPKPAAKAGEVTIIMIAALKSSFFMSSPLAPCKFDQHGPDHSEMVGVRSACNDHNTRIGVE